MVGDGECWFVHAYIIFIWLRLDLTFTLHHLIIAHVIPQVAGTHPELAPDVEMKLSFPKANKSPATASSINSKDDELAKHQSEYPEVFFYKNNQLCPANGNDKSKLAPSTPPGHSEFEFESSRPYYNSRRSLSLARIDSGMSCKWTEEGKNSCEKCERRI